MTGTTTLPTELYQRIINYLAHQPYAEVVRLMADIVRAEAAQTVAAADKKEVNGKSKVDTLSEVAVE